MATQLYVLANRTTTDVQFTNTETAADSTPANALTMVHTGGKDGDYCNIPDCSDETYFKAHHMSVTSTDAENPWTVAFWNNDLQNHLLYYSLDGSYQSGKAIEGSSQLKGVSLLLVAANDVRFFPY